MARAMTTTARPRSSIWSYRSLIWNFAQRDLKSRFKGTALGWIWSLVVPLATLFIYSLVFAVIFKATPPDFGNGRPGFFPVWLFAGLIPWSFFLISVNTAIPTLLANGPILQKVYFPSYAPILGSVAAILVQTLIECVILAASLLVFRNVGPTWLLFPLWLAIYVAFVSSIAASLAIMNVYYRDLAHLTNVALQLLFFLTPIIYQASSVPEEWHGIPLRAIVMLNPIALFVESFRGLSYDLQVPPPAMWLGLVLWTVGAMVLAFLVYRRRGLDIGEAI
jgi:ABC-type polysaccharide/polyol phosphate export permease